MTRWAEARRLGYPIVAAAMVGFVMVTPAAVYLQAVNRRHYEGMDVLTPAVDFGLIYVLVLPSLGWLLLWLVKARPAWAVSLLGWAAMRPVLKIFDKPGGLNRTAWAYGFQGALAYGLAAALIVGIGIFLTSSDQRRRDRESMP